MRFKGSPDDYTRGRKRFTRLPGPVKGVSKATGVSAPGSNELLFATVSTAGVKLWHSQISGDEYLLYYAIQGEQTRELIASSSAPWDFLNAYLHTDPAFGQTVIYTLDVKVSGINKTVGHVTLDLAAFKLSTPSFVPDECTLNMNMVALAWTWPGDQSDLESFQIEREDNSVWIQIASTMALFWSGPIDVPQGSENFRVRAISARLAPSLYSTIGLTDEASTGGTPATNRGDIDHRRWTPNLVRNASFELSPDLTAWANTNATISAVAAAFKDRLQFVSLSAGGSIQQDIHMPQTSSDLISFSVKCGTIGTGVLKINDQYGTELASVPLAGSSTVVLEGVRVPPSIWEIQLVIECSAGTCEIDAIQCNQGATVDAFELHTHDRVTDVYGVLSEHGSAILQNDDNITAIVGELSVDDLGNITGANYSFLQLVANEFELANQSIATNADNITSAMASISGLTDIVDGTDSSPGTIWAQLNLNTSAIQQNEDDIAAAVADITINSGLINDPATGLTALSSAIDLNTQAIVSNDDDIASANSSIQVNSNAIVNSAGDIDTLESTLVMKAEVQNGEIKSVGSVAISADLTGSTVAISADAINMTGLVTVLNDPANGSTLIDGGKIFAGQEITVGPTDSGNAFVIDGLNGKLRSADSKFIIEPEGSNLLYIHAAFGQDTGITRLTNTGDMHLEYWPMLVGNYKEIELENQGFMRFWEGSTFNSRQIRNETSKDRITFYSDDLFSASVDRTQMSLTTSNFAFYDPNEAGAKTRVNLNSTGLNFYDSSGNLTGSYPKSGISGGSTTFKSGSATLNFVAGTFPWANPYVDVTFTTAYPDTNYLISLSSPSASGVDGNGDIVVTPSITWSTKTVNGFRIHGATPPGAAQQYGLGMNISWETIR